MRVFSNLAKKIDTHPKQGEERLSHFPLKPHLKRKNKISKFYTMFKYELVIKKIVLVKSLFFYLSHNITPFVL